MLIISIVILLVILLLFLISSREQKQFFQSLNSKEHPLRFFYSTVSFLRYKLLKKEENLSLSERILSCKKGASVIFGLIIVSVIVLFYELKEHSNPPIIQNNEIRRPSFGEGDQKINITYQTELGKESIDIIVSELALEGTSLSTFLDHCCLYLDTLILGKNFSNDEICSDLNFVSTIPGTKVKITYEIKNLEYIKRSGKINFKNVSVEGSHAKVKATLNYEGILRTKEYNFLIYPQKIAEEIRLKEAIVQQLLMNEANKAKDTLSLPSKVLDFSISWSERKDNTSVILFFIGIILACLLPVALEQKVKEKEEIRKQQMRKDYPEIVSKFQLLLFSGMTMKGAWIRIVNDYVQKKQELNLKVAKGKKRRVFRARKEYERFAYEEMLITKRELELGITEGISFEHFGKRCKIICYIRFASLLSQNLRMGSHGIAQLLEQEAKNAFQERKEMAKQLGEKASTKLLLPTMGMLVLVIALIMVPAVLSF